MNICPKCGREVRGRPDKKFCSDKCRNGYNNKLNSDDTNLIRNINNSLRKNRRILKELNPGGTSKVNKHELINFGFNFDYFTSLYASKAGKEYRYCYDQGYLILDETTILLVESKL
ncbi:MAG: hypothetical protein ABJH72_03935 [Reichenbachiella sp.]|uniref:hypothetical protein n=1 Tax=Reichenbachiella sp. TaxID=2184521 RepID=UPI0032985D74